MSRTIDENDLLAFSKNFRDRRQLEKDYLLNLMLKIISINKISERLVFKGGTALNYFYGLDRFSEDLDFTYVRHEDETESGAIGAIDRGVAEIINDYDANYVVRKRKAGIIERDATGSMTSIRSEIFIEGPLFRSNPNSHKIKLDISMRDDLIAAPKRADKFISKYKDIGGMLVYVMGMDEILSEKLSSILERNKARDLYDVYFLLKYKKVEYDKEFLAEKLKKRGISFDKKALIGNIRGMKASTWKEELSYLIDPVPALDEVIECVASAIR